MDCLGAKWEEEKRRCEEEGSRHKWAEDAWGAQPLCIHALLEFPTTLKHRVFEYQNVDQTWEIP